MITIDVRRPDDQYALVLVDGEIDISTTAQLDQALEQARVLAPAVVIDLCQVRFLAAAGIRSLSRVVDDGPARLVCAAPGPVLKVLSILGLDRRWPVHHELAHAVAHIAGDRG